MRSCVSGDSDHRSGGQIVARLRPQAQFPGLDGGVGQRKGPHRFEGTRGNAAVGVHDHEPAGGHQRGDDVDEVEELVFQLPLFPLGAQAPGGRVEDDALVGVASLRLPTREFHGVLHHPADAVQAASLHVGARPIHDLPDGVAVDDVGAHLARGEARAAGVGEQVEELVAGLEVGRQELPIVGLLGEEADVLEFGHLQPEGQIQGVRPVPQRPPGGRAGRGAPLAVGSARGLERGVGPGPGARVARRLPEREGVGTHQGQFSKPLEAFAVAGIQQGVVAPFGGEKSGRHGRARCCLYPSFQRIKGNQFFIVFFALLLAYRAEYNSAIASNQGRAQRTSMTWSTKAFGLVQLEGTLEARMLPTSEGFSIESDLCNFVLRRPESSISTFDWVLRQDPFGCGNCEFVVLVVQKDNEYVLNSIIIENEMIVVNERVFDEKGGMTVNVSREKMGFDFEHLGLLGRTLNLTLDYDFQIHFKPNAHVF